MKYWDQVQSTYDGYLSKQWDQHFGRYGDGGCNPWLLTIHSIRAGHLGMKEDRDRARILVDEVARPGVWNPERASWEVAPHLMIGSHPSVESRYVESLYYAWKYREAIRLDGAQVDRIVSMLRAKAEHAYRAENWGNQESFNWYNNATYLAFEVTGDEACASYWKEYTEHFVDHIDKPGPSSHHNYLFPDFAWYYNERMPFEALEYGHHCYAGAINYQKMHDRGLYSFSAERLAKVRGYQQYVLGTWRLDGYPNWDTGYGHERLLNAEYWAFGMRALTALSYAHSLNARPEDRHYARFLFDRAMELFARMDTWDGDPEDGAVPLQPYGVGSNFGDKFSTNAMFIAEVCIAIEHGIEKVEPRNPKSLWRYYWYHRKLAVSTESYSAAVVSLGMRRFDYGGLELAGLFDRDGRSLAIPRGTHFPRAISLEIPEEILVRTHNVGLTATPQRMPKTSPGECYFTVVESPDGDLSHLSEYDPRVFTPSFDRIVAKGNLATANYRYDTRFTFEQDRIGIQRELSLTGQARRGMVIATVPVGREIRKVFLVDSSGESRIIMEAGKELPEVLGLDRMAYLDFEGEGTGFIIVAQKTRLGSRTAAWSKQLEGSTIIVGKHCRTVFLCLAGHGDDPAGGRTGEPIESVVFDTWWMPTDGSPNDAERKWRSAARAARQEGG